MDDLVKQYDSLYEDMAEAKAEGGAAGYSQKPSGSNLGAGKSGHGCIPLPEPMLSS